jgi:sarcosine oxidase subunit delta
MLLIRCPYCEEERPELEFRHAGEAHIARPTDIASISDEEFEKFFFIRSNPKGIVYERWRHVHGCGRFFNAVRNTVSDKFYMTYKAGEPKPDIDFAAVETGPAPSANREPSELNVTSGDGETK